MPHIKKLVLIVLLFTVVLSGTTVRAEVENLPSGMLIGDQNGISVSSDGAYFIEADALEAGDVITKQLTIMNTEEYAWKISMSAEPLEETGPLKLLDEVRCTIALEGTVLYDGRVRGDEGVDMIRNALDLGTFESGEQRTLDITLTVNPDMKKYYWSASESYFRWNFIAAQDVKQEGPKTGEIVKSSLYFILPGIVLVIGGMVIVKRRRDESSGL